MEGILPRGMTRHDPPSRVIRTGVTQPGPDEPEGPSYPMRDTISFASRSIQMPHSARDTILIETETSVIAQPTPCDVPLPPPIDENVPPLANNPLPDPPVLHESSIEVGERAHSTIGPLSGNIPAGIRDPLAGRK
jgi:hypothetical protein